MRNVTEIKQDSLVVLCRTQKEFSTISTLQKSKGLYGGAEKDWEQYKESTVVYEHGYGHIKDVGDRYVIPASEFISISPLLRLMKERK